MNTFEGPLPFGGHAADQPCHIYAQRRTIISEADLQQTIEHMCSLLPVMSHHCADARKCRGNGWPDHVIVGPYGVLFRELKVAGRPPTLEQRRIGELLKAAGCDWGVWTERDYSSGEIRWQLASICQESIALDAA
jgi:hypothetical protein